MRRGAVCLVWLLVAGCGLTVGVNDNPTPLIGVEQLSAGTRVRVHSESQGTVIGDLVRIRTDSIVFRSGNESGTELALPAAIVERVDISLGRRSRKGRGALIGLVAGTVGGFVALQQACQDECVGAWPLYGVPVAGALVGAGLGAIVGSQIKTERWQRVSWP